MADLATVKKWYDTDKKSDSRKKWWAQRNESDDIRRNQWNLAKYGKGFRDVDGHVFDYNPYHKIADYNSGILFGQPLKVSFQPGGEDDDVNAEVAEKSMQWSRELVDARTVEQESYQDLWWKGFDVKNIFWDAEEYHPKLVTGVPVYERVNPDNVILDSTATGVGDMKRIHRERFLLPDDVVEEYPRLKKVKESLPLVNLKGEGGDEFKTFDGKESDKIYICVIETQYFKNEYVSMIPIDLENPIWSMPVITPKLN